MGVRPAAEVEVTAELVARLVAEQHPDLADRPVRLAAEGWDVVVARLGENLAVRLPRRALAVPLLLAEQRWIPVLGPRLGIPVPTPLRSGRPSAAFRWPWTVVAWLDGDVAADTPVAERTAWAPTLAAAVRRLHRPAPPAAPVNPVRGGALRARDAAVRARLRAFGAVGLERLWDRLVAVPGWDRRRTWVHGDLHPANLLVRDGLLAGILDFGDVAAGDPATDLASAWLTFDAAGRAEFRAGLGAGYDEATWQRGRGWALVMASAIRTHADDDPVLGPVGRHALGEVLRGDRPSAQAVPDCVPTTAPVTAR